MNLLHLEYFKELAYSEHLQETSKALHVSASSISVGLRNLEQELGVSLFDRVGRNMQLNEFGKLFLPYVEQAFHCLNQGVAELDNARLQQKNRVSFSIRDAAFWCGVIGKFNELHPDIYIRQVDNDPDDHGKLLDHADLDFIMTDKDLDNDMLDSCVLYSDYLVLAVPQSHPLAGGGDTLRSIFEFQTDTFLFRPKRDYFQQCVDRLLLQIGFKPQRSMEFEYVLRSLMLDKSIGVIITTEQTIQTDLYHHAVVVRIAEFEGIPYAKKLYWKRQNPLSPSAVKFRDYLKETTSLPPFPQRR